MIRGLDIWLAQEAESGCPFYSGAIRAGLSYMGAKRHLSAVVDKVDGFAERDHEYSMAVM